MLVEGKKVKVEFGRGKFLTGRDSHDRLLGYLYDENDRMVNKILLEEGMARVAYIYDPDNAYVAEFRSIEKYAREKGIGIWSIKEYVQKDGFHGGEKLRKN